MRRPAAVLAGVILAVAIFFAGYAVRQPAAPAGSQRAAAQAASYTCPMHPQIKSDRPSDCPLCGMRLEPVDAVQGTSSGADQGNPGMVVVNAARQQLIGVSTDEVRREPTSQVLRVPGRIAVDDQRLYRIVAAVDGWIIDLRENTVGRFVRKNQLLGSYYTNELLSTERLFLLSIPANQQLVTRTKDFFSQASIRTAGSANPQYPIDSLRGLGMDDLQIEEIHKTRQAAPHVNIYSPVSGFVLARNISPRQRFDKGTELYQIGDLGRVWVLTDIFEKDRQFLEPGEEASVLYQGRRLKARMTDSLPQFNPDSRTLQARFELDNPEFLLQPGMFVDVELEVDMPPAITVPSDALFDSGLRKTVFVDRGDGNFEARRVETGWRLGDRIEVVRGLMEGERIVASANFLLDSESRMRAVSAGVFDPEADLVCGMEVDAKRAVAAGRVLDHDGTRYYFCSDDCREKFRADPAHFIDSMPMPSKASVSEAGTHSHEAGPVKDFVCGMDVDAKEAAAAGLKVEHAGKTYYFCADDCKKKFQANPAAYIK
ncbi:MAG: efflux RND transporter periplasmic adaptor subunit [Acidobacteria bacterium]|nr:efflux RND transporter periplasmic adaptor subunit [Acidobacteriota bacterium]